MDDLSLLTGCELHVHLSGCLYPEDIWELGKDVYRDVDWTMFEDLHVEAFGEEIDTVQLFAEAKESEAGWARFCEQVVFGDGDEADFGKFRAKYRLGVCLGIHWTDVLGDKTRVLRQVIGHHRQQGLDYVAYRVLMGEVTEHSERFLRVHRRNARTMRAMSGDGFKVGYLISLPRDEALAAYALVQEILAAEPELIDTIVGLDFCSVEEGHPPKDLAMFFERLHRDNERWPERALPVAYHVGESFFDKSVESGIRWCHEAALLGAKRLGHAIALGMDPAVAVARRPGAHEVELVSERLDQIAYDLRLAEGLRAAGVVVDEGALRAEADLLGGKRGDELVARP
ncbi:MAG TPA: hypothetical protein VLL52_00040, partial [Anaerolineae bacterium]|nr:hypothetical protein [Anaerolineae bacterium]